MSLRRTVILAIGFGASSCIGPLLFFGGAGVEGAKLGFVLMCFATLPLAVMWALFGGYAFYKFGKRGWPTMLGARPAICSLLALAWIISAGWVLRA